MTASTTTPADNATSIISALKLSQLVAIAMIALVMIIDVSFVAVKILAAATAAVDSYVLIVALVSTSLTLMVAFWSIVTSSGAYVSASASLMQVAFTGGQGSYPPASSVTPYGITGTNLTANDLAAVQALIAAGKVSPSILSSLATMTPSQISAVLQALQSAVSTTTKTT